MISATPTMAARAHRLMSMQLMSAGQAKANTMLTAMLTPAQTTEVARSVPLDQPYIRLVPPLAAVKRPAATYDRRAGHDWPPGVVGCIVRLLLQPGDGLGPGCGWRR